MEDNQVIPNPNPPTFEKTKDLGNKRKNVVIIVVGLVLLSLLVLGAFFLGRGSNDSSSESTPTPELTIPTVSETDSTITPSTTGMITATPSSTTTPSPNIKTKILSSSSDLDGFRSSNNGGNNSVEIRAGRNSNLVTRGFVSFDLTDLPQGANVTEASLRLYQVKIIGSPYSAGGQLKVDHLNYGDSLNSEDYGLAALSSSFATLTSNPTLEWKDLNVTDYLRDDLENARSRSQFRIHFQIESTGGNVTGDFAYFESADNNTGSGNTPQLVVKYY